MKTMFKKDKDKPNDNENENENRRHESMHQSLDVHVHAHTLDEQEQEQEQEQDRERTATLSKYDKALQTLKQQSSFLSETPSRHVPHFGSNEITFGSILGVGGFCTVREVTQITLDPTLSHLQPNINVDDADAEIHTDPYHPYHPDLDADADAEFQFHETETREYMAQNCIRNNHSRYAVKKIKQKFEDEKFRYRGMFDLAIEAEYLSHLAHPNIIKMRGSLFCDSTSPVQDAGFYIVLDRLFDTLQQKIDESWPNEYKGMSSGMGMGGTLGGLLGSKNKNKNKNKSKQINLFLDRMMVAHDLAAVFRYLHSKGIIYRDLKPENIGFDIRGDVKLFDFGLCKEIPNFSTSTSTSTSTSAYKLNNHLYKLTVRTGSIPYMAPECMLGQKYNHKVDIFGFGILLWEMFALKIPFKGFNRYDFIHKVCKGPKMRPDTKIKCPTLTKGIMLECWHEDPKVRPEFSRITAILRGEMNDMTEENHSSIRDRTQHLMDRSKVSMHARNR